MPNQTTCKERGNNYPVKRLYWDLEVSPNVGLFWRPGFKVQIGPNAIVQERKIICVSWMWEWESEPHILVWDREMDDLELLRKFSDVYSEADETIAHFGDSFDLPWFMGRLAINNLPALPPIRTVDTKAWASKYFYFNSAKLDYLGAVFGFGHKLDTDFELWKDVCLKNDRSRLAYMAKYCKKDVIQLKKVHQRLSKYIKPKTHAGVAAGHDRWTCPRCASENVTKSKTKVSAAGIVSHQMQCGGCGSYFTIPNNVFHDYTEAKRAKPAVSALRCSSAKRDCCRKH